ncbi:MAG: glycosyltransferase [Ilumatobacter sp.]
MTMISDHLDATSPGLPPLESEAPPINPSKRLVIVVRADPVICGHSGEARNLAEAALTRGYDDVRIVTWPIDALQAAGLPLKPLHSVLPYSAGITVERPEPVGDYKVPDGRHLGGIVGRLVELFTEGVPTTAMSLYLTPHDTAVSQAAQIARSTGMCAPLTTIAEAVGSDITNVVRSAVEQGRFGAAANVLSTYLSNDVCVAVSQYTKDLIVDSATAVDQRWGTQFAPACAERVEISYPAIDSSSYTDLDPDETDRRLAERGLRRDGYVMFLSRLAKAKGVDDLINGFAMSAARSHTTLVICGSGPEAADLRALAASTPEPERIVFLDDVDDAEKPHLMAGSSAYVLASKPRPEFVETFGIALAEKMLAGGGPIITCDTGGIPEAIGPHAKIVPPAYPVAIANALSEVILGMSSGERARWGRTARCFAMQFDRTAVFDRLIGYANATDTAAA